MHRLTLVLAIVPALVATGARAQSVSDDVAKQLWCGEAFVTLYAAQKSQVTPDVQSTYDAYVAAANALLDKGTQGYLDAGYTEEQVDKLKTDLVTEVTPVVTGQASGKYSETDCEALIAPLIVLPVSSEAPSGAMSSSAASDTMSSSSSSSDASSEAASSSAQ